MARAVVRDHDLLDLEQHCQSPAPGRDDRDPRHRRDLHHHHRRHRPFGRRDRRLHLDDGRLAARQPSRLRLVRRRRRRDLARDRRLDRPLPRLRRHADGSAPVHHDAGDNVRAARHRLSHHQRRDDFDRQRRLHRLLARELPGLSLDGRDVVRDAGAVLDGPRRRSPSLYPPHQVPLGPLSPRDRFEQGWRFSPASTSRR